MTPMAAAVAVPDAPARMPATTGYPRNQAERTPGVPRRRVALASGNVLRIRDGRGVRVTPISGVLWITEEGSVDDVVVRPGGSHRVANPGLTLVLAHGRARVMLEAPAGASSIELASADGQPGRRVAFGISGAYSLDVLRLTLKAAVHKVVAGLRRFGARSAASPPRRGWVEPDRRFSSWRVRVVEDLAPSDDPAWSTRDFASGRFVFPYY
jgi:hypothetical protein